MSIGVLVHEARHNSNITVQSSLEQPWHRVEFSSKRLQEIPRTFLFGRTLQLESDGTEELRMPECVRIAGKMVVVT